MTRVLHIVPSYLPAVRYGGPIRSVHGLAKGLVVSGHRVVVLTTNIDGPGESAVPLDRPVELDGVTIHYVPVGRPRRVTRAPAMRPVLERLLREVELVHLHAVWQWPTWLGSRMAERAGIPYVISPRGMLVRELIRRKSALAKKAWLMVIERRTLGKAAAIHATSATEACEIRALGLDLAPIGVVANGVDLPEDQPTESACVEAWEGIAPGRRLVYLGRLSWEKGIDRLLRAVAGIPGVVLTIAGNDEEGMTAPLIELAGALEISERVRFVGPVHGARKWALLAGADLLVLPSLNENWGIVVTEALGVGTPVIVTKGVGAAELVARHDLGAVVEGTPEALAGAIRALLADPDRRAAIGERARCIIAASFTHAAAARGMSELYAEILGRRARQRAPSARAVAPIG